MSTEVKVKINDDKTLNEYKKVQILVMVPKEDLITKNIHDVIEGIMKTCQYHLESQLIGDDEE